MGGLFTAEGQPKGLIQGVDSVLSEYRPYRSVLEGFKDTVQVEQGRLDNERDRLYAMADDKYSLEGSNGSRLAEANAGVTDLFRTTAEDLMADQRVSRLQGWIYRAAGIGLAGAGLLDATRGLISLTDFHYYSSGNLPLGLLLIGGAYFLNRRANRKREESANVVPEFFDEIDSYKYLFMQ